MAGRRACRRHLIGYADRFFAAGFVAFPFFFPGCLIAFFGCDFFPIPAPYKDFGDIPASVLREALGRRRTP